MPEPPKDTAPEVKSAIPEGHYPRPPNFSSCSPAMLCEHAYVVSDNLPIAADPPADAEYDRESRDQHRMACLLRDMFLVTVPDNNLWVQDESGAWNLYERGDTDTVEYLLKRAYLIIGNVAKVGVGHLMSNPVDGLVGDTEAEIRFRYHALAILAHLTQSLSGPHLRNLSYRLRALNDPGWFSHIRRIPALDMDDYQKTPLLPLMAGGCLNLETGCPLDVDAYAREYRSGRDRAAVTHKPELLDADDADDDGLRLARLLLAEHYPPELITFIAYLYAYPAADGFGMLKGPPASGKTTLFRWLAAATGSAAVIDNTEPVSSTQFTPIEDLLASCHVVAIDETDEDKGLGIARGVMNRLTAATLTTNAKFGAMRKGVRRLGAPVLLGNDWPGLDSTVEGLDRRIVFAWDKPMPKLAAGAYQVLRDSRSAQEYLLAVIAQRAFELRALGVESALTAIRPQEVVMAKGRFMDIRRPALLQHLESCLSPSAEGHVTAARMKKLVSDFGERVSTREVSRHLTLLGASKASPRLGDPPKVTRVWSGVEESTDDEEDDGSPPAAGAAGGDSATSPTSTAPTQPRLSAAISERLDAIMKTTLPDGRPRIPTAADSDAALAFLSIMDVGPDDILTPWHVDQLGGVDRIVRGIEDNAADVPIGEWVDWRAALQDAAVLVEQDAQNRKTARAALQASVLTRLKLAFTQPPLKLEGEE